MAEILKKHKKAVILMSILCILIVWYSISEYLRVREWRENANFIVVIDDKEVPIPIPLLDIPVHWEYSDKKEGGGVAVMGIPEEENTSDPTAYPICFRCYSPQNSISSVYARCIVGGITVSRRYPYNVSINGISLNDSNEVLFEKMGKPHATKDLQDGTILYAYYLKDDTTYFKDYIPDMDLRFIYSKVRGNFDSFALSRR